MSLNGQTDIFYFLQSSKQTQIPCMNLITLNLNEPFPLVPCINLINHFSKAVRINKKKTQDFLKNARGSNNRPNKPR